MAERWLPVALDGFADLYEVSDLGRVRSVDRWVAAGPGRKGKRLARARLLTQHSNRNGYFAVKLWRDGRGHERTVHSLVLGAFVGPRPDGLEACHGPAGPLVNQLDNLSWGTHSQNTGVDRLRDGTDNRGARHGHAKLTEENVRAIRIRVANGETKAAIARDYGVARTTISSIVIGKSWKHTTEEN